MFDPSSQICSLLNTTSYFLSFLLLCHAAEFGKNAQLEQEVVAKRHRSLHRVPHFKFLINRRFKSNIVNVRVMNNPSVCHPSGSQTPCVRYLRLRANPQDPEHNSRNRKEEGKKSDQNTTFVDALCGRLTQTARVTRVFFFFVAL